MSSSGLSYQFTSLSSTTDSVSFSSDNGATYNYTPLPDALGVDSNVTNVRVVMSGAFLADTGAGAPNFQVKFRVEIQ